MALWGIFNYECVFTSICVADKQRWKLAWGQCWTSAAANTEVALQFSIGPDHVMSLSRSQWCHHHPSSVLLTVLRPLVTQQRPSLFSFGCGGAEQEHWLTGQRKISSPAGCACFLSLPPRPLGSYIAMPIIIESSFCQSSWLEGRWLQLYSLKKHCHHWERYVSPLLMLFYRFNFEGYFFFCFLLSRIRKRELFKVISKGLDNFRSLPNPAAG